MIIKKIFCFIFFYFKSSEKGCPYYVKNLNKNILPDRLKLSSIETNLIESKLEHFQKEQAINSSDMIKIEPEEKIEPNFLVRPKRGRPPKRKAETLSKENLSNPEIVKIPTKRGRKPKNRVLTESLFNY